MTARRPIPAPDAVRQLEALVRDSAASGIPRQALLLRLSALPPAIAQAHHRRLALEALEPLSAADRARLFVLPNGDAAMVWRGPAAAAMAEAMARLRHLFSGIAGGEAGIERVALHLGLPEEAPLLAGFVAASRRPAARAAPPRQALRPLDLAALSALESALAQAELSRFARRRPVCNPIGAGWRVAWERRVFDLAELAEALAPDRDLAAEPWLFRRLARALDRRMMALLAAPRELDEVPPFAVALAIASVLSPEFLRFDAALPARLRGRVALELRPDDMLADTGAYVFARDFARARGYRIVAGPIAPAFAACFAPEATGADLIRLTWADGTPPLAMLGLHPGQVVLAPPDTTGPAAAPPDGVVPDWPMRETPAAAWARAEGIGLVEAPLVEPAPPSAMAAG